MITLMDYTNLGSKSVKCDFGCDTTADVANLPTTQTLDAFGFPGRVAATWSIAIVAEGGIAFYKTAENTWAPLG